MRGASDPHQRFGEWLLNGAPGEPPRDLAVHASVCAGCAARIAALDLLGAVDPGLAARPPTLPARILTGGGGRGAGRYTAAFVAVTIVAALVGVAGSRLLDLRASTGNEQETPGQAVLGGTGRPSVSPDAGASASVGAGSEEPTVTPTLVPVPPPPAPAAATPHPPTAKPSAPATATASPTDAPTASPTPVPTASPSPTDSPTPEPTPVPPQCGDGIDNDGDDLVDLLDPGCADPADNDESDA